MQCPYCGRKIMKSATDAEIRTWFDAHLIDKVCQKVEE